MKNSNDFLTVAYMNVRGPGLTSRKMVMLNLQSYDNKLPTFFFLVAVLSEVWGCRIEKKGMSSSHDKRQDQNPTEKQTPSSSKYS